MAAFGKPTPASAEARTSALLTTRPRADTCGEVETFRHHAVCTRCARTGNPDVSNRLSVNVATLASLVAVLTVAGCDSAQETPEATATIEQDPRSGTLTPTGYVNDYFAFGIGFTDDWTAIRSNKSIGGNFSLVDLSVKEPSMAIISICSNSRSNVAT